MHSPFDAWFESTNENATTTLAIVGQAHRLPIQQMASAALAQQ
jgi:hypothetical protein